MTVFARGRRAATARTEERLLRGVGTQMQAPLQGHRRGTAGPGARRPDGGTPQQLVDRTVGHSRDLGRLLDGLHLAHRLDNGSLTVRSRELDLASLVAGVLGEVRCDTLRLEPTRVVADPEHLTTVVRELLDNAVRHTGGAPLSVTVGTDEQGPVVVVRDLGPGLPQPVRDRLLAARVPVVAPPEGLGPLPRPGAAGGDGRTAHPLDPDRRRHDADAAAARGLTDRAARGLTGPAARGPTGRADPDRRGRFPPAPVRTGCDPGQVTLAPALPMLDTERCYRAVSARDSRFDGRFVTAVRTTGIYCRPSCPATTPLPGNVTFLPTAAAAQASGYRACRRCLPDAAPGSPEWDLRGDLAARAMRLVADGLIERAGVPGLAAALGYSERHLGRVLTTELGAGPLALARAHRAHTARLLLQTTDLPVAEVAFAAGFASVRQFNDTVREVFAVTPSTLRSESARPRGDTAPPLPGQVRLRLPFRLPLHVGWTSWFLAGHALDGAEEWADGGYARSLALPHGPAHGAPDLPGLPRRGRACG